VFGVSDYSKHSETLLKISLGFGVENEGENPSIELLRLLERFWSVFGCVGLLRTFDNCLGF
jgi:hypothetical protein